MADKTFSQMLQDSKTWAFGTPLTPNDYLQAGNKYTFDQLRKMQMAKTLGLVQEDKGALGGFSSFMKDIATPVGLGFGILNSINQFRLQNKQLNMMDKQLQMATEQWENTKQEMNAIRKARSNIVKQYNR